jgi:hypothetical protein
VDPVTQGRAAAFNDLLKLLTGPPDDVRKIFDLAAKESK